MLREAHRKEFKNTVKWLIFNLYYNVLYLSLLKCARLSNRVLFWNFSADILFRQHYFDISVTSHTGARRRGARRQRRVRVVRSAGPFRCRHTPHRPSSCTTGCVGSCTDPVSAPPLLHKRPQSTQGLRRAQRWCTCSDFTPNLQIQHDL